MPGTFDLDLCGNARRKNANALLSHVSLLVVNDTFILMGIVLWVIDVETRAAHLLHVSWVGYVLQSHPTVRVQQIIRIFLGS